MQSYFHFTTVKLAPGSRMLPGNWGRFIRAYDIRNPNNSMMLSSELILEQVRQQRFPERPSRLDCNYIFDSKEIARAQRPGQFGDHFLLYEVRIVEPSAPLHRAAFNLLSQRFPEPGVPFLPHAERLAMRYWQGEDILIPEILTASPLEFVRCLD